jgi:hypothetical protein
MNKDIWTMIGIPIGYYIGTKLGHIIFILSQIIDDS